MAIPAAVVGAVASGEATIFAITNAVNKGTRESENLIKKAINGIKSAFTELADQFDKIKSVILDTTKAFAPFTVVLFNRAILDLKATFGQIFLPIVKEAIVVVRNLADIIYNLPTGFKTAIRAVTEIILAVSGVTAASVGVVGAIAAVVLGLVGFTAGVVVLAAVFAVLAPLIFTLAVAFLPLTAAIVAISAVLGTAVVELGLFIRAALKIQSLMTYLKTLFDIVAASMSMLFDALGKLLEELKPIINAVIAVGLLPLIVTLTALTIALVVAAAGAKVLINVLKDGLIKGVLESFDDIKNFRNILEGMGSKSSFGLGWSTSRVDTDPNAIYNRITEELLRNTRMGAGEEEDPAKKTAKQTLRAADILQAIWEWLQVQGQPGNMVRNVGLGPVGLALR